jgi:phenylacetate-CoA ligase
MNLFHLSLKLNGFPIKEAEHFLADISGFKSSEFIEWKEKRLWEIFNQHYKRNKYYRALVEERIGDKPIVWSNVPILKKQDFQHSLKEMLTDGYNFRNIYIGNTSGSSGHPFFFAKDKLCHALTWALVDQRYNQHGIILGKSIEARFYGIPLEKSKYIKEKVKDLISSRIRFPVFDLSYESMSVFIKKFESKKINYINGYASTLAYFAKFLEERNICLKELCPTLQVAITTAELMNEGDRNLMIKSFGVPVVNEYGASEVGIIAIENNNFTWQISDEIMHLEVVDDKNNPLPFGQEGRILLTSLFNRAMPFIRYEIGDIGKISYLKDEGKNVLQSLEGRTNDFALLPSGKKVPGLAFYYISKSLLEGGSNMREFIIKQIEPDLFIIEYVAEDFLSAPQRKIVSEAMDLYLEPGLKVEFERKVKIDRTASGKLRHFQYLVGNK